MYKKLKKNLSSIPNNNIENKRNNNELKLVSELNNKLSLECSYLINEIKRKDKTLLASLETKKKRLNLKKLIISDKYKNFISKYSSNNQSKISNLRRFEQLSDKLSKPKMLDNSDKSISLSSLFNLPKVKTRNKINVNQKVTKNNNFSVDLLKKNLNEKLYNIKRNNFFGIHHYMKDNYYSDIENDLNNKIQTKYFRNDSTIKREIIAIKKFESFWKKMVNYCEPIIIYKRYQLLQKNFGKNYGIRRLKITKSTSTINS